jgi:DNA-binding MarR family transcriptional regulator
MRAQLDAIGIDDLPRNGAFMLAGIANTGGLRGDLPSELGITKQAVSQAIDILVTRGYLDRGPDADDRRRITLTLTARGYQAIEAVVEGVDSVDEQLRERVGDDRVDAMRKALMALAQIKTARVATGAGKLRPPRQLQSFSPIFPVRDLASALAHYGALGFATVAYADGREYGFAERDGTGIHLAAHTDHDPAPPAASAYLYVRDADALYGEWSRPEIGGTTRPVGPTPYKLREGSHTDPDGNVIRFGSPVES